MMAGRRFEPAEFARTLGALLRPRRVLAEWLALALAVLALGGYMVYSMQKSLVEREAREQERLASHALIIERNLVPQVRVSARALESILEDLPSWKQQNDGFKLANRRLLVLSGTLGGIRNILIVDARGRVLSSNQQDLIGRDVSARPFFQTPQSEHNAQTLYVASPYGTRRSGYVMSLSRVITAPDGSFDGLVIAGMDPEYFAALLESIRYTPQVQVSITHGSGVFFMMVPPRTDLNGRDLAAAGGQLARHLRSGRTQSIFSGVSDFSAEDRMVAFRSIQSAELHMDRPLVVAVSRDRESIFSQLHRESRISAWLFGLASLVAVIGLWAYQRRRHAFDLLAQQHEAQRQRSESDLRAHALTLEELAARMLQHREDEKKRIAFDLHEGLAQTLSAVKLNVEIACQQLAARVPGSDAAMKHLVATVQSAIAEVRGVARGLRPSSLDDLGLTATIRGFCRDYARQHPGVRLQADVSVLDAQIPLPLSIIIYRVIEEICQVLAHSEGVQTISLALQRQENRISLVLEYGSSRQPAAALDEASLEQARELAILSGASFTIARTPQGLQSLSTIWSV